jgi:hypothetical protein
MSIIIEATASRIRPTLRSASARSLLRSTCCSRVKDTAVRVRLPLAALWPSPKQVNLNEIRWGVCEPLHACWGPSSGNFFEEDRQLHKAVAWVSKADIRTAKRHVCFTPESGHVRRTRQCPLWAKSGRCLPTFPQTDDHQPHRKSNKTAGDQVAHEMIVGT